MSPTASATGSTSPRPLTIGCSRARTGVTTTSTAAAGEPAGPGWASLRRIARRWPEVSDRGESRSWGNVSHAGK